MLTALLVLFSYSLVCPADTLCCDDHPYNETKSSMSSANLPNDKLNINKEHVNHCQNLTWLVESKTGKCECADSLDGIIICDANSNEVFISSQFCMSYDKHRGEEVVGRCPYIYTSFNDLNTTNVGLFVKLPSTVDKLEHIFCDHLNREGYFCSGCKKNLGHPMYPDFIKCVECDPKDYARNWILYIVISFGPLTLFLILVVCLRISATSAPLNSFIFVSQIITLPPFEREFYRTINSTILPHGAKVLLNFLHSLYGLWNLNFFTTLIPPFCVPHQNVFSIILLVYIIAAYPLFLLIVLYILIELYSRNFMILVWLWKPFRLCYRRFQRQWDIRSSIIDAFATFFLLSYVKLLFISFDLLAPSRIWSKNGTVLEITSYFDANKKVYPGSPGILILIVSILAFVYMPTIFLLLYPCRFCQKLLTCCSCLHFRFLRFLMDSFLGSYKDGMNGTRDYRYFASLFLIARVAISVEYAVAYFNFHIAVLLTCSILATMIAVAQPYNNKYAIFNRLDPLMILILVIWLAFFMCIRAAAGKHVVFQYTALPMCFISLILPMVFVLSYWLIKIAKKWYPCWICKKHSDDECWYQRPSYPYTPQRGSYGAVDNVLHDNA